MTEVSFKLTADELIDVERACAKLGINRAEWVKTLLVFKAREIMPIMTSQF